MKRKRQTLFFWKETRSNKRFALDDDDDEGGFSKHERRARDNDNPQLELMLKEVSYRDTGILPYELLLKIFKDVIQKSDHPIKDLYNLARVCEGWRQIVIGSPSLWSRIDLTKLPVTDRNLNVLNQIFVTTPTILNHIKEIALSGSLDCKTTRSSTFLESLITVPNLETLSFNDYRPKGRASKLAFIYKSIKQCTKLHSLSIVHSKMLFNNQKWLSDHLFEHGRELETLNLAMSLTSISSSLFRAIGSDFCPNLKFLDISTCDTLTTHSFDAISLAQNLPNLEVLRVANVSFKRVHEAPSEKKLKHLKELSMPIGIRDADRDDALFSTLAFGSSDVARLDLRGASITPFALLDMPSFKVRELHMDDLCPIRREDYHRVILKWRHTLEVLSLIKINCSDTISRCLEATTANLCSLDGHVCKIRELDLSASDVSAKDLLQFLNEADSLSSIKLSSCRSLPRGCKDEFSKKLGDGGSQTLRHLKVKLKQEIQ